MFSHPFSVANAPQYGLHPMVSESLPEFHDEQQYPQHQAEKEVFNETAEFKEIRKHLTFAEYILCKHYCHNEMLTDDHAVQFRKKGTKVKFTYFNGVGQAQVIFVSKAPLQQNQ